jgi:hypothetical protein
MVGPNIEQKVRALGVGGGSRWNEGNDTMIYFLKVLNTQWIALDAAE